jgi:hypothetical protein
MCRCRRMQELFQAAPAYCLVIMLHAMLSRCTSAIVCQQPRHSPAFTMCMVSGVPAAVLTWK